MVLAIKLLLDQLALVKCRGRLLQSLEDLARLGDRLRPVFVLVRDDGPVVWSQGRQGPFGLDVRLIEAWEDVVAVVGLELSVQILLHVDLVGEGVDAVAIIAIVVDELDGDLVHTGSKEFAAQGDHAVLEIAANFSSDSLAIDVQTCHACSKVVDEDWLFFGSRHRSEVEGDGGPTEVRGSSR